MLLRHASESLAAIYEGIDTGCIDLFPSGEDPDVASDPAPAFRARASRFSTPAQALAASTRPSTSRTGLLASDAMAGAGALRSPSTGGTCPARAATASQSRPSWPPTSSQ